MASGNADNTLIDATRPFMAESRARSWFHVVTTFALMLAAMVLAAFQWWWPLRLTASILGGLLIVRAFILFHDFMHGAILRGSRPGRWLFNAFGVFVLTPSAVWRETHNYHHAHTAKIVGSNVGSFPVVTTEMWSRMTPGQRFSYRVVRHPLTIVFAYVTLFVFGMGVQPFLRARRKHVMSAVAVMLHAAAWVTAFRFGVLVPFCFSFALPVAIAHMLGGYLFYAQHNYPAVFLQPRQSWTYTRAALESSSYMEMGPVMRFFTGNIGYHHVHHLNPTIPFYRLPEAMASVPELQNPGTTSLNPRDVIECLRLKLWDPDSGRMVGYRGASDPAVAMSLQ